MPALNIDYTEDELAIVRASAAADGKTVKQYVKDASIRERQRRAFVAAATRFWQDHVEEFDAAFAGETPTAGPLPAGD